MMWAWVECADKYFDVGIWVECADKYNLFDLFIYIFFKVGIGWMNHLNVRLQCPRHTIYSNCLYSCPLKCIYQHILLICPHQSIYQQISLNIIYLLKYAKRIGHKINKLLKSSPTYNKLQHYLIEHACIWIFLTLICVNWIRTENEERN
jgi:hypothetical protein